MSTSVKELKKRALELGVYKLEGLEKSELESLVSDAESAFQSKRRKQSIGHPVGWWEVDPRSLRGRVTVELGEVDSLCVSFGDGPLAAGMTGEMNTCKATGIVGVKLDAIYMATDDGKDDVMLPDDMLVFRGKQLAFSFKNTEENADGFKVAAVRALMEKEIFHLVSGYDDIEAWIENGIEMKGIIVDPERGGFFTPGVDFDNDE